MIQITQFKGLATNVSPYSVAPAAAVTQVNIQALVPGQLSVRPGLTTSSYTSVTLGSTSYSFFNGRDGATYGINGLTRGIRITDTTTVPIGVQAPAAAATVAKQTTGTNRVVKSIYMVNEGAGYYSPPSVAVSGGGATVDATAKAELRDGRISGIRLITRGEGYTGTPEVTISGGFPSMPTLQTNLNYFLSEINVAAGGAGYTQNATTSPSVVITNATSAYAVPSVNERGEISGVSILYAGQSALTEITAAITGGGGAGAQLEVSHLYSVASVTVTDGGSDHATPPLITFRADEGGGAVATASVTGGTVDAVTVLSGGLYASEPEAIVADTAAAAVAEVDYPARGQYLCCHRYVDDTTDPDAPSNISELVEIDATEGVTAFAWQWDAPADARVTHTELWRTTADQGVVLYRVARIAVGTTTYTESLSDEQLTDPDRDGYALMPITLPNGQLNARRFGVLPSEYSVGVIFQDRAWFAADSTGAKPNSLLFSEVNEPESVPAENELIIQENAGVQDSIVALIPLASQLLVVQTEHLYSLRYVAQPVIDASINLAVFRGILTRKCWATMGGVAFIVDSFGMYAFDGSSESPLSAAVDNYWRDGIIDFSQSAKFHVSANLADRVVRFFYCRSTDSTPVRALCYCVGTQAWWEEEYPEAITETTHATVGSRRTVVYMAGGTPKTLEPGVGDGGSAISWQYRSGNLPLTAEPNRAVGVLYTPTTGACDLKLRLHYNGSTSPRQNAVASDRGSGFTTATGSTEAVLDMDSSRSGLGSAVGYAEAHYAGRMDPRSSGGDRHVAVAMAGTQGPTPVVIHGVTVSGVAG
jgi:hypothetical protein